MMLDTVLLRLSILLLPPLRFQLAPPPPAIPSRLNRHGVTLLARPIVTAVGPAVTLTVTAPHVQQSVTAAGVSVSPMIKRHAPAPTAAPSCTPAGPAPKSIVQPPASRRPTASGNVTVDQAATRPRDGDMVTSRRDGRDGAGVTVEGVATVTVNRDGQLPEIEPGVTVLTCAAPYCDVTFTARSRRHRYCCGACRKAGHDKRHGVRYQEWGNNT